MDFNLNYSHDLLHTNLQHLSLVRVLGQFLVHFIRNTCCSLVETQPDNDLGIYTCSRKPAEIQTLSISETAYLLGISCTNISRVCRDCSEKEKISSEQQLSGWKCADARGQARLPRLDRKPTKVSRRASLNTQRTILWNISCPLILMSLCDELVLSWHEWQSVWFLLVQSEMLFCIPRLYWVVIWITAGFSERKACCPLEKR